MTTSGGVSPRERACTAPRDGGTIAGTPDSVEVIATASGGSWLYRSLGGGGAWATVKFYGDGGAGWDDLGFTNALQGVVIHGRPGETGPGAGSQLLMTHDAGGSWEVVPIG